jgi:hypothetical protein
MPKYQIIDRYGRLIERDEDDAPLRDASACMAV